MFGAFGEFFKKKKTKLLNLKPNNLSHQLMLSLCLLHTTLSTECSYV